MATRKFSYLFKWLWRLVGLLSASALFIASSIPSWALAQSTDDSWTEPLNLSHSGVATNPAIVLDSDGVGHALWQDDSANYVYSRLDSDQWSTPERTDLNRLFRLRLPGESFPSELLLENYTGPNPMFIARPDQHISAFWITPRGRVFTNYVHNQNFGRSQGWDSEVLITSGAALFAAALDTRGGLHLAFLRTVEDIANPPGIYYTRSTNGGRIWTKPVLMYESPYLQTLENGEANISIATGETEDALNVYLAWDNRPRKEVFLAHSANGGESWEQPELVAGPAPGSGLAGPFYVRVGANQNSVVLVWQNGQPGGACSQLYQSSSDAGATWSEPQPMVKDLLGCAQSNEFVPDLANSPESPLYFLTETQSQVFLTAWNGLQWSQPLAQPILSGFEDSEVYREVTFGCLQASLLRERLYIVGCDQGGGGDIWVTSRDLGSHSSWFSSSIWSQPSPVFDDSLEVEAVELVATDDGLIHTFFSQHRDPAIYYTFWDGEIWSRISAVLDLPEGEAGWPAIAAGPGNELFLIAPNNRGAVYFTRATSGNVITASSWSPPTRLGLIHDGKIGSVDVAWDAAGTVFVAYSVPVNDERGIYLVQSKDHGTTWSVPLQVFNGEAAGFDLVGAPSLLISENGVLHITWKQQSIQGDGVLQPLSLLYTRSEDGGRAFGVAELVVDEPVAWHEIVTDGNGNLHLLWQPQDTMTTVWDQISMDGGRSWQFPQGLPNKGMSEAIIVDSTGRLHLVDAGPGSLGHWLWDGSRWQPEEPLLWSLASHEEEPVELLAAAVNKQGKMVVVLVVPTGAGDATEKVLLYSARTLELPPRQNAIQETPTQTLLPPAFTPVTPTLILSSTPTSTVDSESANPQNQTDRNGTNDPISPFTIALIPVALLLIGVLSIVLRRAIRARDR